MKFGLFTILYPVIFVSVVFGQNAEVHSSVVVKSKSKIQHDLTEHDLITPVFQREYSNEPSSSLLSPFQNKAGLAFAGSAILPGFSQAANKNWIRAGIFFALEATSIIMISNNTNRARRHEQNYENWADENWSVVQYSRWLVDYHQANGINNQYIDELQNQIEGLEPAFNPDLDWPAVSLQILRNVERNSPFITTDDFTANSFSHTLPNYGSQQYYELISKYYQYQAGWRDYHDFHDGLGHTGNSFNERYKIDRNGLYASPMFFNGAERAEHFNNLYRLAGNFTSLLIVNHIFSAFDAYFTVRLKQNRIEATPSLLPGRQISMTYRF